MGMIKEFKDFAIKGNVVDLAVGIIIGGAFGGIVTSFVNDIIMPPLGLIVGGVHFSDLKFVIKESVDKNPAVTINYGSFLQVVVDFLIIAFVIFMMIKAINKAKGRIETPIEEAPSAPPTPSNQEILLSEIRDLLKNK